jgi:hypothetical protein
MELVDSRRKVVDKRTVAYKHGLKDLIQLHHEMSEVDVRLMFDEALEKSE